MRLFLFFCLFFALTGCNTDQGVQRNYIISQTGEEPPQEVTMEN